MHGFPSCACAHVSRPAPSPPRWAVAACGTVWPNERDHRGVASHTLSKIPTLRARPAQQRPPGFRVARQGQRRGRHEPAATHQPPFLMIHRIQVSVTSHFQIRFAPVPIRGRAEPHVGVYGAGEPLRVPAAAASSRNRDATPSFSLFWFSCGRAVATGQACGRACLQLQLSGGRSTSGVWKSRPMKKKNL